MSEAYDLKGYFSKYLKRIGFFLLFLIFIANYHESTEAASGTALTLSQSELTMAIGGKLMLKATKNGTPVTVSWKSLNSPVASISRGGVVTAVSEGKATMVATMGSDTARCSVTVVRSKISLSKGSVLLWQGYSETVSALVTGRKGTVSWVSQNPGIAVVDQTGKITGKRAGYAVITATVNGASASCNVRVYEPAIDIRDGSLCLFPMDTRQLTIYIQGKSGKYTIRSLDPSVVSVTSSGKITAVKPGRTYIEVKANGISERSLVVVQQPVQVSISRTSLTLPIGAKEQLHVTSKPSTYMDAAWKSLNARVVEVNQGNIEAKAPGRATITVTAGGVTLRCSVTVMNMNNRQKALYTYRKFLELYALAPSNPQEVFEKSRERIPQFNLLDVPGYDVPLLQIVTNYYEEILHDETVAGQRILCYRPGKTYRGISDLCEIGGAGDAIGVYRFLRGLGYSSYLWYLGNTDTVVYALKRNGVVLFGLKMIYMDNGNTIAQILTQSQYDQAVSNPGAYYRGVYSSTGFHLYHKGKEISPNTNIPDNAVVCLENYLFAMGYANTAENRARFLAY